MSTFHSLEVARQALFIQQTALHTTSHNIANANTEGYSRQRVNFETNSPFPAASRNRPQIPGQIGTGVKAGAVERIRNEFLDTQFRTENSQVGYWEAKANALARIENLMNEPTETGLSASMNQFWSSLEDLSVNPENSGARSVVLQQGQALADTFTYFSDSLSNIRSDLKQQINTTVLDTNALIEQIHQINEQVTRLEPHGYVTNDLYDKRDRLIDELSSIMNIKVTKDQSGDGAPTIADGVVTIELMNHDGSATGITLVDGVQLTHEIVSVEYQSDDPSFQANTELDSLTSIHIGDHQLGELDGNGGLKGLIESYNNVSANLLSDLDKMTYSFAREFNRVHSEGHTLNGAQGDDFFGGVDSEFGAASSIFVQITEPEEVAAATKAEHGAGDGQNIQRLAEVFDAPLNDLGGVSPRRYYESIIGELAVEAQQANRMTDNATTLRAQVDNQRMSVSSVSLDEEMTNMIQFQHAYNAAARNITAVDEMLDRIINNMGLVGR